LARYTLRSTIALDPSPATVFARVNESLLEEERMCTLAYLILEDHGDRFKVTVSLAGHPPPILVTAGGAMERLGTPCPPVGVMPEVEPIEEERWLQPSDLVVLYTDGYVLSGHNPPDSVELAVSRCDARKAAELLDEMLDVLVADLSPLGAARDDIALLALRANPRV